MLPLLVASRLDPAGYNMASYIIEAHSFTEKSEQVYTNSGTSLFIAAEEALGLEWLDKNFSPSYYVFLSRHRSESGIPTVTCHTTGNFSSSAEMGGNPRELAYCYPSLQKHFMRIMSEKMSSLREYQLVIEATHHGPTSLTRPVLFVEIGSTPSNWNDEKAVSVVADSVLETIHTFRKYPGAGIALGGTHYPSKFSDLLINSDYAIASVASKHNLPSVDEEMIHQMIGKSVEKIDYVFLDWKGLGREKERLNNIISTLDLEVVKV